MWNNTQTKPYAPSFHGGAGQSAGMLLGRKPFVELRHSSLTFGPLFVLDYTIATHRHRRAKMLRPDPRIVHERSAAHRQGLPFQSSAQLAHAAAGMDATAGMDASSVLAAATLWLAILGRASAHHRYVAGHRVGSPSWPCAGPAGSRRQQITRNAQMGNHWRRGCRRPRDRQRDGWHPGTRVRPHRLGGSSVVMRATSEGTHGIRDQNMGTVRCCCIRLSGHLRG